MKKAKQNETKPKADLEQVEKPVAKKIKKNEANPAEEYQMVDTMLTADFYKVDVVELAQKLIGKIIVRQLPQGEVRAIIVETEAYKAPEDKACHAYNNKKTDRTKYFWQDGGHLYVYSIYGNNYCLNITAATKDDPEAVLIRAVQPLSFDIIKEIRKTKSPKLQDLSNGPGKCGGCLLLDKSHNGLNLCDQKSGMYLIDNTKQYEIGVSARINIDYAEEWKDKPWRFYIKNNSFSQIIMLYVFLRVASRRRSAMCLITIGFCVLHFDKQIQQMKPNHCDTIFNDDQFQTPTRQQKRVITETTIKKPFQQKQRQCTCKKSQCLKMYCDCLAFGEYCGSECSCQNCHNDDKHPEQRNKVLEQMVEKNTPAQIKCNCRKSNCQKKYCECYNAGVKCSELCKCDDCKNSVKLGYNQFQIGNQKFILIPVQTFEQLKSQQK